MLCYFLLLAVDYFPVNTVMCCASVLVSFEIYRPWNRKFYLVFTGSRKSCMVFVGFERTSFDYGLLIHFAWYLPAQYFPFSNFNELSKFFQSITRLWWFLNFFTGQTKSPGYSPGRTWLGHWDMARLHYLIIYSIYFLPFVFIIFPNKSVEFFKNLISLKYRTFRKFLLYI